MRMSGVLPMADHGEPTSQSTTKQHERWRECAPSMKPSWAMRCAFEISTPCSWGACIWATVSAGRTAVAAKRRTAVRNMVGMGVGRYKARMNNCHRHAICQPLAPHIGDDRDKIISIQDEIRSKMNGNCGVLGWFLCLRLGFCLLPASRM